MNKLMSEDRELLQKVFYRIARDSQFTMDMVDIAHLGAKVLKCYPWDFLTALDIRQMTAIANGTLTPAWKDEV